MFALMNMTNGIWEWVIMPHLLFWAGYWFNTFFTEHEERQEAKELAEKQSKLYNWELEK